jgi:hypothetical protein
MLDGPARRMEMSDINDNLQTSGGLTVQFVQQEYFIERIFAFEEKYKHLWNGWYEFLEDYQNKASSIDRSNFELDEWAFLCEEFQTDLFLREIRQEDSGPPGESNAPGSERPEHSSGLSFGELTCLIQ